MENTKTRRLVQLSLLLAIEAIFCFTPLGSLPIGPMVATLAHVPVILAAILLGTGTGAIVGFSAGLFSFIVWTFMPPNPLLAFVFTPAYKPGNVLSLVICFVPRILIGVFAGLCYKGLSRIDKKGYFACIAAAVAGTLANTLFVLFGIYTFFGEQYAQAIGVAGSALLGLIGTTIATNGILEVVIAVIVALGIAKILPTMRRTLKP